MDEKNSPGTPGDFSGSTNAKLEEPSVADVVADAQREWSRPHSYAIIATGIVWGIAFLKLGNPDLAESRRILWTFLPLPFLGLGLWTLFARDRRLDELNRAIEREAASFAMKLTTAWMFGLILLSEAGNVIDWEVALLWPLLFYTIGWVRARRRLGLR